MSTAAIESPAPSAPADAFPATGLGMSKSDVRDAVFEGVDPSEIPSDDAAAGLASDEKPAEAKADAKPETEAEKKPEPAIDEDAEAIKAINRRSRELRKQRMAARQAAAAPAMVTKPPEAKPEAPKPEAKTESTLTESQKLAAQATKDILDQIARLAGDDEAAKAPEAAKPDAERTALVGDIKANIDKAMTALNEGVGAKNKALEDQVGALKERLAGIESAREVRDHITRKFSPIEDDFPTLSDPKAIRAFNKEHGTAHRDAIDILHDAMGRAFEKYKFIPPVKELAKAIEKKLAAKSPENTEKPKPSRTLSSTLGSPPAARTDPDNRTAEEAVSDFNRKFGLED